jgi:hypothetical protein
MSNKRTGQWCGGWWAIADTPANINAMDKYEVSKAIEALKADEEPNYPPLPDEEPF